MNVRPLSNALVSDLEPYQTMRRSMFHLKQGIFVAEGERCVRRLLESRITIRSLLLTDSYLYQLESELKWRLPTNTPVYVASAREIQAIAQLKFSQAVLAVAEIPNAPELTVFARSRGANLNLVALNHVNHAVNVGSIIRNAAAFGVDGVLVADLESHPFVRRAVRTSLGAVFQLPVFYMPDLRRALEELHLAGVCLLAADPKGDHKVTSTDFNKPLCLVFGNEHKGVSSDVLALPLQRLTVPMERGVDSLNVASASAVILHAIWAARSRNRNDHHRK